MHSPSDLVYIDAVYSDVQVAAISDSSISRFGIQRQFISHGVMEKSIHSLSQRKLQRLLRQIRSGAGLRQEDLAQLLGKRQSFVSKYESGERRLDVLELRQICQAVGIPLADFASRLERLLS